jgi:hypothetical protein
MEVGAENAPGYQTGQGMGVAVILATLFLVLVITARPGRPAAYWRAGAVLTAGMACLALTAVFLWVAQTKGNYSFDVFQFVKSQLIPGAEIKITGTSVIKEGPYLTLAAAAGLLLVGALQMRSALLGKDDAKHVTGRRTLA